MTIDLDSQTVRLPDGSTATFPIDGFSKTCLLEGVDQLGYLLLHEPQVATYEQTHSGVGGHARRCLKGPRRDRKRGVFRRLCAICVYEAYFTRRLRPMGRLHGIIQANRRHSGRHHRCRPGHRMLRIKPATSLPVVPF